MNKLLHLTLLLSLLSCSCDKVPGGEGGDVSPDDKAAATVYVTTKSVRQIFQKSTIELGDAAQTSFAVYLDPAERYQTMDGFGAAMTWASCYNLLRMTQEDRTSLLRELFDPEEGLGISLVRVSVGASDFNKEEYTWCDREGLDNFNIDPRDAEVVLPVLKEMYAINPDVKIIASPWSVPKWMKMKVGGSGKHDSWTSGRLDPAQYQNYATYFVKWIQTMESNGFNIYALTPQNEPLNHGNSMSTYMPWKDQRDFIKNALGRSLESAGLKTKILIFDHNYNYDNMSDQKSYPLRIYDDPEASRYVAGSAWHNYGGTVSELDHIVESAPDKDIYFTEASIGEWNYSWDGCILADFRSIFLETMKRGCRGITLWNMVLDDKKGPYSPAAGSCKTCYGAVELSSDTYKVSMRRTHYYQIAHASKVVKPGAVRIGNSGYTRKGITYLTFLNPDGSYAALILNENSDVQQLSFVGTRHSVKFTVPAQSIVSLIWND